MKIIKSLICMLLFITATIFSAAVAIDYNNILIKNTETGIFLQPPPEEWNKTFGGDYYDSGFSVKQTTDGGYIFAGTTIPTGSTYSDIFLVKTDSDGNTEWTKNYGGPDAEYGYSVQETTDGGYIVVGYIYYYSTNKGFVYLLKTDSNGDQSWTVTLGGPELDEGFSGQQTTDGGYIITGFTDSFSIGRDVYLTKTDSTGKFVWDKSYGGAGTNIGNCVRQTMDGGYIIVGSTSIYGAGLTDIWLIKTDSNGEMQWDKTFGGTLGDFANSIEITSDGGYIITGTTMSFGAGGQDVWVIRTDSTGNEEWSETFGGVNDDRGEEVKLTSDGDYIVTGVTNSFGAGSEDAYLIKIDENGDCLWTKTIGGVLNDFGHSIQQTTDGGYIIAGETLSYGSLNSYDAWLIKTRWGNTPPGKPTKPSGKTTGKAGELHEYKSTATDPEGDQIYYWFDWGELNNSGWVGPYPSGTTGKASYSWPAGTYTIKVKAKDIYGAESPWSDSLTIKMPRGKIVNNGFLQFLQNHPNIFPFFQIILQKLGF